MSILRHPSLQSHLSVDWTNPIDYSHRLNKGLIGWWLNVPHWQGGTTFRNLVGLDHGTLTQMDPATDWVAPTRRGGWGELDFDGSSDYLSMGTPSAFNDLSTQTISFWLKPSAIGDYAFSKRDVGCSGHWRLETTPSGGLGWFKALSGTNTNLVTNDTVIVTGAWHHVILTWDGTTDVVNGAHWYVNGIETSYATQTNATGTPNSDSGCTLRFGSREGTTGFFLGVADDLRILNQQWSPAEVAEYYELSQQYYPGLLNRVRRRTYSVPPVRRVFYIKSALLGSELIGGGLVRR